GVARSAAPSRAPAFPANRWYWSRQNYLSPRRPLIVRLRRRQGQSDPLSGAPSPSDPDAAPWISRSDLRGRSLRPRSCWLRSPAAVVRLGSYVEQLIAQSSSQAHVGRV